jgi:hypothetical protein
MKLGILVNFKVNLVKEGVQSEDKRRPGLM